MHAADLPSSPAAPSGQPWWKEMNRYHWLVLAAAALGWLFDTMDQQLFVLARTPALSELLGVDAKAPGGREKLDEYGRYATAIFMAGWATGGLIFGMFGDRWGRVRTMMLTILVYSAFTGLSALSVSWWDFALYRFLTGMGVGGEFAAGVALVAEAMPARSRLYALALLQALSAVGNMMAAGIGFLLPAQQQTAGVAGWRLMFVIGVLPAIIVYFVLRRIDEPETWKKAKAEMEEGKRRDELHKQMGDMRELFRNPTWRYHTIVGVCLALVGVLGLWGVAFFTAELIRDIARAEGLPKNKQDDYASLGSLLQNFGAFFGIYVFSIVAGRLGRRAAFRLSYGLAFVATVAVFGFMTKTAQVWWMIPLFGFCVLMVFGGFAVYFPELYPTRLRSTGTSFCYNVARYLTAVGIFVMSPLVGMYAAPKGTERGDQGLASLTWLSDLGSVDNPFRYTCLTISLIYLLGFVVVFFAPETKDKPLPEEAAQPEKIPVSPDK
jgi:MFS family permease